MIYATMLIFCKYLSYFTYFGIKNTLYETFFTFYAAMISIICVQLHHDEFTIVGPSNSIVDRIPIIMIGFGGLFLTDEWNGIYPASARTMMEITEYNRTLTITYTLFAIIQAYRYRKRVFPAFYQ
jgi:hypothetical protein